MKGSVIIVVAGCASRGLVVVTVMLFTLPRTLMIVNV